MKTIVMIRHAKKDGELIDLAALEEIRNNGIPALSGVEVTRIHAGSEFIRTMLTARGYRDWLDIKGGEVRKSVIPSDPRLGSEELFGEMLKLPNIKEEMKQRPSQFAALKRVATLEQFRKWSEDARDALRNVFNQIHDGEVCLSVGHTPIVEMVANACMGWQLPEETSLKELEGFKFVQDKDGSIMVSRL